MKKTICFFGIYDPNYSRNQVLRKGFIENGWDVVEIRVDPKKVKGLGKYMRLLKESRKLKATKFDIVLVAFPGHTIVWLARILFGKCPIYFDAFLSRYDSNVYDRKIYSPYSFRAWLDWFWDWSSCALADKILLDTYEHIYYFAQHFFLRSEKMIRVPIGADTDTFYPRLPKTESKTFTVHFHGMFIPLQGLMYILDAAHILRDQQDICFQIIGSGQEYEEVNNQIKEKNISNVHLLGKMPVQDIPSYIEKADVCLGIFGDTEKTERVIPNKVYEYIAMKKAVVTADTPAIREFFINEKHMVLCDRASGESIADALLCLKNNRHLVEKLAQNSYEIFAETLSPKMIVSNLIKSF